MAKRRLAYVLKRFPRVSETFIASEIIELRRQGEDVAIFALSRPDEEVSHAFLRELDAPVTYLPHRPLHEPIRVLRSLARVLCRHPAGWWGAARISLWPPRIVGVRRLLQATVLCDEMERAAIDHVHAHFATAAARLANLAWRMSGVPYSVTAHAKDIYHREVQFNHLRDKLGHATFTATVTSENREYLVSVLGDGAQVHVVPNSVDLRRFPPRRHEPESNTILTVARLVEKKGIGDLIEACRVLTERGEPVCLEIAGTGELRSQLEAAASRAGIQAVFLGVLPHEKILEHYRRAAVFCLPCVVAASGDRDGLPTAVLEAIASGVPVVTTPVNGLTEVVMHEKTGLVVPQHNPSALADAIARLLHDPVLARCLAERARSHVEASFSLQRSVATLRSLFPEAV